MINLFIIDKELDNLEKFIEEITKKFEMNSIYITNNVKRIKSKGIKNIKIINKDNNTIEQIKYYLEQQMKNNNKKHTIEGKVLKILIELGFNVKHRGTKYLRESINLIYKSKNQELIDNLEKNIYPVIAKKHNIKSSNVKSNIIKATNFMYDMSEPKKVQDFFSFSEDIKPTPKILIQFILNKLRY